jgi:cyclophilin family peptidyl-prolyl cis-trans isomerase
MMIDSNKDYSAVVDTNYGKFTVKLYAKQAPLTVNNFVFLARQNFFNDIKFHRIVKGFVIQTGDPKGNGTGDAGYRFSDELPGASLNYKAGALAMANSGPNTNGSQFFVCLTDLTGRLPKNYSIFGEVTEGMDVIQQIGNLPVTTSISGEKSKPTVDVFMKSVTVTER